MKKILVLLLAIITIDVYAIEYFSIDKLKQITFLEDEKNPFRYQVHNVFDNNLDTIWAADDLAYGKYDFEITFEIPITIDAISIAAGYFNDKYYKKNNRIKEIEVIINDNNSFKVKLLDEMKYQKINLKTSYNAEKVSFKILSTYPGTKWNDTCISEISFSNRNSIIENGFYQLNKKTLDEIHYYKYNKKGFLIEDKYDYFVKTAGSDGTIRYKLSNTGEVLSEINETEVHTRVSVYEYRNKLLKSIMTNQTFTDNETYRYRTNIEYNDDNNIISKEKYSVEENKILNKYKYTYKNNQLLIEEYNTDNRKSKKTYYYNEQGRKSGYYYIRENWKKPNMYYYIYNKDLLVAKLISFDQGKEIKVFETYKYDNKLKIESKKYMTR